MHLCILLESLFRLESHHDWFSITCMYIESKYVTEGIVTIRIRTYSPASGPWAGVAFPFLRRFRLCPELSRRATSSVRFRWSSASSRLRFSPELTESLGFAVVDSFGFFFFMLSGLGPLGPFFFFFRGSDDGCSCDTIFDFSDADGPRASFSSYQNEIDVSVYHGHTGYKGSFTDRFFSFLCCIAWGLEYHHRAIYMYYGHSRCLSKLRTENSWLSCNNISMLIRLVYNHHCKNAGYFKSLVVLTHWRQRH